MPEYQQIQYHYQQVDPGHHLQPYQGWPQNYPQSSYSPGNSIGLGQECAVFFALSAVFLSFIGAYLGGASVNNQWLPAKWNWDDPNTAVQIVGGATGGLLIPYGFFYANNTLGPVGTVKVAVVGAYIGAAMVSRRWSPLEYPGWDFHSPAIYNGAFKGMEASLWLIDAIASIHAFADEARLKGLARGYFIGLSYASGILITYHYISQYHNGNYAFWDWDRVHEPGTVFAIIDGMGSGTRIPVGFAIIGRDLANRTAASVTGPGWSSVGFYVGDQTFKDIDPWELFGAGFIAFLSAADENKTFDFTRWDWKSFSTWESILVGIVYGRYFPQLGRDVRRALNQKDNNQLHYTSGWGLEYKKSLKRDRGEL